MDGYHGDLSLSFPLSQLKETLESTITSTRLFYELATTFSGKITLTTGLDKTCGHHQSKTHTKILILQLGIYILSVSEQTKDIGPNT